MNYSPDLFGLLQEVKYLLAMQQAASSLRRGSNDISVNNLSTFEALGVMATEVEAQHQFEKQLTAESADKSEEAAAGVEEPTTLASILLRLYAKRDEFWQRKVKLIKICEFYNGIRGLSTDDGASCRDDGLTMIGSATKLRLIRYEVDTIDERVEKACATLTWRTYGKSLVKCRLGGREEFLQY